MEAKLQQQDPQKAQASKPNLTGIPTQMKLDFEQRSGLSFDDVRVHYNSDMPAQLQALAYTQGTQVYVGPGQERHLPHELGHVIQQKAFPIHATSYVNGVAVNDNPTLETQADILAHSAKIKYIQTECANGNLKNTVQRAKVRPRKTTRSVAGVKKKSPKPAKPITPFLAGLKRPRFNQIIKKIMPIKRSGLDRRHIIPFLQLKGTLVQIIHTELTNGSSQDTIAQDINLVCNKWSKPKNCGTLEQEAKRLLGIIFNNEHNLILDTSLENQALGRTMGYIFTRYLSKEETERKAAYDKLFLTPTSHDLSFLDVFQQIVANTNEPLLVAQQALDITDEKGQIIKTIAEPFVNHVWGIQIYGPKDYDTWSYNLRELYLNVSVDVMNKSFYSAAEEEDRKKLEFILGGGHGIDSNFYYRFSDATTLKEYLKVVTAFLEGSP